METSPGRAVRALARSRVARAAAVVRVLAVELYVVAVDEKVPLVAAELGHAAVRGQCVEPDDEVDRLLVRQLDRRGDEILPEYVAERTQRRGRRWRPVAGGILSDDHRPFFFLPCSAANAEGAPSAAATSAAIKMAASGLVLILGAQSPSCIPSTSNSWADAVRCLFLHPLSGR